jgi:putative DNA primase/helicase
MDVVTSSTSDDDSKVVQVQFPTTEERARRLQVAVDRLAMQSLVEQALWLDRTAEEHGIEPAKLKAMVDATVKVNEKKQRAQKAEERQSEQRAERQQVAARREEERQQREQRRAQEQADKEAERRQREREKELTALLKLPSAEQEPRLAALAKRLDEDLDFLREELGKLIVAEEEASAIASVAPWPEPVATAELLNEVQAQLARFVVIHDEAMAVAVVLWIALAWIHEIAVHSPLLVFTGADADIGKTTAAGVVKFIAPCAYSGAELTGPSLYRFVDSQKPTLIIDDADRLLHRRRDLVHIINVGWTRGTKIPRQDHGVTRWFDPFCPKVLAGVDLLLPKTTATRAITIRLLPKLPEEKVEEFNHVDDDSFVTLRRKFARWAADNAATLKDASPVMTGFNNRTRMNWKLLLAIAELAGGDWVKRARAAAVKLSRQRREPSEGKRLLAAFRQLFMIHGPELTSKEAQDLLAANEDSEWGDFHGHGPISKRQIALLLDPFDVHPNVIHPRGRKAERGYKREWFEVAFRHYLTESPARNRTTVRKPREKPRK